jgi:exoribonuclease II
MKEYNDLFRITSVGDFDGQMLRHVSFHATKDGTEVYIKDCERRGRRVELIEHFRRVASGSPSVVAMEVAARVWCDQDMGSIVMDSDAALEIAEIIDRVRKEQAKEGVRQE